MCARSARASTSSARVTIPSAPWPAAGSITLSSKTSTISSSLERRASPARASTSASHLPSRSLRRRVSTLPRAGSTRSSGRAARIWAARRGLEVPTRLPAGRSANARRGCETRTSRGSSRFGTEARTSPSGSSAGTSLRLCTAAPISRARSCSSSSFVKSPFQPMGFPSADRRSPVVRISTISTSARPSRADAIRRA